MTGWPDFFIIGAMKAGTTTLYHYLRAHNDIFMCYPKEPGYFSRPEKFAKGEQWYQNLYSDAARHQLKGESSTCYSRHQTYPDAPERIHCIAPNAKFIYLLRNPIERAYSHYGHEMQKRRATDKPIITYKEAIKTDGEMLEAGLYAEQLDAYLKYFSLSNFLFIKFDDLRDNPEQVARKVFDFIGVSPDGCQPLNNSVANNSAGTTYAQKNLDRKIRFFKDAPVLGTVINAIPASIRSKGFKVVRGMIRGLGADDIIVKKHKESLSKPDEKDKEYLIHYYKSDSTKFTNITGVDLSDWYPE